LIGLIKKKINKREGSMRKSGIAIIVIAIILVSTLVLGACGTSTTATTPVSSKVYELKFSYHTPERASMVGAYFVPWTAAIEKASNGRIKITHYGGETLVKIQDQYDGVVSGLSDIALIETDVTPGRFPKTEFFGLPELYPNAKVAAMAFYDIVQKYSASDELKEVKILGTTALAGAQYVGTKPAQKIADFKGQRMRSGGKIESWLIEQLGATPIEIGTGDLPTSMERKLVDSCFLTWSLVLRVGIKDVTKYRTECDMFGRVWVIVMNKKVWDSMPADLQKVIMDNSGVVNSGKYSAANEALAAEDKAAIEGSDKGQGNPPIYMLSASEKEAWKTAVAPTWDRWIKEMASKGLPGQQIIDETKALVQKYSTQ
jgi:TRAP-type C4-dicarboxylate transport system substrate-binding protein